MAIGVNLDLVPVKCKMELAELAERVGITLTNLSIFKRGKARAIRFSILETPCRMLGCQPGDLSEFRAGPPVGPEAEASESRNSLNRPSGAFPTACFFCPSR